MKVYIAKDKSGYVFTYKEKPRRVNNEVWDAPLFDWHAIQKGFSPRLTWESAPIEVEIKWKG